jgi:hypothetical protein
VERFEYKIVEFKRKSAWSIKFDIDAITTELNSYGSQGWEAISNVYQPNTGTIVVILKRKK